MAAPKYGRERATPPHVTAHDNPKTKIAMPPRNPTPSKTSGVPRENRPIPQTRPTEFIYEPYPSPKKTASVPPTRTLPVGKTTPVPARNLPVSKKTPVPKRNK